VAQERQTGGANAPTIPKLAGVCALLHANIGINGRVTIYNSSAVLNLNFA